MRPTHIQIREFLDHKHPLHTLPVSHCTHPGKRFAATTTFKESILVENDSKRQNRLFSSTHQNDDFHCSSNWNLKIWNRLVPCHNNKSKENALKGKELIAQWHQTYFQQKFLKNQHFYFVSRCPHSTKHNITWTCLYCPLYQDLWSKFESKAFKNAFHRPLGATWIFDQNDTSQITISTWQMKNENSHCLALHLTIWTKKCFRLYSADWCPKFEIMWWSGGVCAFFKLFHWFGRFRSGLSFWH
jgi:hypothetical protein